VKTPRTWVNWGRSEPLHMVALSPATQIPSNINTLEKLFIHAAMALQGSTARLETVIIANETAVPTIQVQQTKRADGTDIFAVTGYIPCDVLVIASSSLKPWQAAQDISTATINAVYTSN